MAMGSLFSGIGGLELGLEAAGFGPVVWQVEIDPFCRQVLAKHWPGADRSAEDVCTAGCVPRMFPLERVDLICGGFPCQDLSAAGRGAGLEGARSGLWYECRRIIGELRPRIAVIENVSSGAARWLPQVRRQLCELGYDTAALAISASDVGAPHRRARIFVVGFRVADVDGQGQRQPARALANIGRWSGDGRTRVGDPRSSRRDTRQGLGGRDSASALRAGGRHDQPRVGGDLHGLSAGLDGHQWPAGRGASQHAHEPPRTVSSRQVPNRAARVSALGNSVVPQCALVVGRWLRAALDGAA